MEKADQDLIKSREYAEMAERLPDGNLLKEAYVELARAYRAAWHLSSLAKEMLH